jgi:predicted HAD superfamily phosphohydrolase
MSMNQGVGLETLANQISVALEGSALEQLYQLNSEAREYVINTSYKYYQRRWCEVQNFQNNAIVPISNDKLPYLQRNFSNINLAAPNPDAAEY